MRFAGALAAFALLTLPARALETPESITNARVELRPGVTPVSALDDAARAKFSVWIGWSVPATPGARDTCCFSSHFKSRGCSLADRDNSWGTSDSDKHAGGADVLFVLVEAKAGAPSRVRVMSPTCPVDGADRRLVWLGTVDSAASLAALGRLLDARDADGIAQPALAAIAYHQDAKADAMLEKRAFDASLSKESRQQAIFWAGNARGDAGYRLIDHVLISEPNGDLRQHAVFALTQSSVTGSVDRIKKVAVEDRDRDVRAQALFWLAQSKAAGAGEWIVSRLDAERDDHVREQAVFALSQLEDGTDWLLRVLRSKRDPETTRRALFWLGQSDDPRALEEIEKILVR